jgi:hypothetical protein
MLLHVKGSIRLEGRGEIERSGGSVEQSIVGNKGRHSSGRGGLRVGVVVVFVGKEKRR